MSPVSADRVLSSLSNKHKLLFSHFETPCTITNIPNQIFSIKPTKPKNQIHRKLKKIPIPALAELGPAQPQLVYFFAFVIFGTP